MPVAYLEKLIFRESTSNRISSLQEQERKRLWEKSLQVRRMNSTAKTVLRRGKLNVDGHGIYVLGVKHPHHSSRVPVMISTPDSRAPSRQNARNRFIPGPKVFKVGFANSIAEM